MAGAAAFLTAAGAAATFLPLGACRPGESGAAPEREALSMQSGGVAGAETAAEAAVGSMLPHV